MIRDKMVDINIQATLRHILDYNWHGLKIKVINIASNIGLNF